MTKAEQKRAVEKRTHERPVPSEVEGLAARKVAAKRGVESRRRKREELPPEVAAKAAALKKHEARLVAETRKVLDAEAAARAEGQQPEVAKAQTKRPEANTARRSDSPAAMVTVALRGEQAERFRALAAAQQMSLSKLLVRMMEAFEAQAG